jgi:heme exporter protein A
MDPSRPSLFEARGLFFQRQDAPVFGPLDVQLNAGEIMLVEGDNGSGKTTLLRVIAGLLRADDGSMFLDGKPLDRDHAHGRLILLAHQLGLKADWRTCAWPRGCTAAART